MFLGDKIVEKISGSDLFPMVCELSARKGFKVFFLGSKPGIAEKAKKVLLNKYPTLKVVGVYSPPLGFENTNDENQRIIEMINVSNADILFIGLGSPTRDPWIRNIMTSIHAVEYL
jgi:N-acetylglucosaminyldiphosphoundecaprenol N-acetyl-beta-D-mannosaminyltransferase